MNKDTESCPVCFEKLVEENNFNLKCGHAICTKCFKKIANLSNKCPLCRDYITARKESPTVYLSHGSIDEFSEHLFFPGGRIYTRRSVSQFRLF